MHHVVHLYTKIFYKLFFKFNITKFLWKTGPRGEMNAPGNLLNLYIYIYIWNLEIRIWTYDEWFWKYVGIYVIIKLIFELLILKFEYYV